MMTGRERWASRLGLILAMAGNAIGLGNFLRFPSVAARNGGGAFMIPYFCALFLVGIPLMWVEWSMGRLGGRLGSGTTPRIFSHLWHSRWARYVGGRVCGAPCFAAHVVLLPTRNTGEQIPKVRRVYPRELSHIRSSAVAGVNLFNDGAH